MFFGRIVFILSCNLQFITWTEEIAAFLCPPLSLFDYNGWVVREMNGQVLFIASGLFGLARVSAANSANHVGRGRLSLFISFFGCRNTWII